MTVHRRSRSQGVSHPRSVSRWSLFLMALLPAPPNPQSAYDENHIGGPSWILESALILRNTRLLVKLPRLPSLPFTKLQEGSTACAITRDPKATILSSLPSYPPPRWWHDFLPVAPPCRFPQQRECFRRSKMSEDSPNTTQTCTLNRRFIHSLIHRRTMTGPRRRNPDVVIIHKMDLPRITKSDILARKRCNEFASRSDNLDKICTPPDDYTSSHDVPPSPTKREYHQPVFK